ncbi:MAG: ribosome recycling factor [Eubacteriales bacterium]|nr:ribosome recycling factor [Eubacteriales bacterium]MDD4078998.1 ribosome recycling factor [Eubacteriales bacterium]MDD4769179.1 ribosome recycling factor [Eubacteriales bacterium]
MFDEIYSDAKGRMAKAIDALKTDFNSVRAGRANPALLDRLTVEYYGVVTPVKQMANISAPDPRTLVIQPWDKTAIPEIEKAVLKSGLGLTPNSDGTLIRLAIPQLTQERRVELVKLVRKKTEESKVAIRNIRRDANELIKSLQKDGEISEDDERRHQEEIQKLTDQYTKLADEQLSFKEAEIMDV